MTDNLMEHCLAVVAHHQPAVEVGQCPLPALLQVWDSFDTGKVVPVGNFAGFPISGVGPDPGLGQPECIQGAVSGQACGSVNVTAISRPSSVIAELPTGTPNPATKVHQSL